MHPKDIDVFHLETGTLELCYDPAKGARGIGTREDIFVHEQAPDKVFVLPRRTNTSDLENEDAVIIEKVVDLAKEGTVAADTNMLENEQSVIVFTYNDGTHFSHLERHNLIIIPRPSRKISIV
jgi:hypothetical protein